MHRRSMEETRPSQAVVFGDIHGNATALEAVFQDFK
ncbi:hypothetical protein HNR49_002420 [Halobacterium salinarum]|uniref:Uncharacterized protein n=1 Tax=Halobacterium salinarum TaxID=2242 RepID=A0A841HFA8_HALSI|nr:hypothetical protein [Halobacterium salinarum]